MQRLVRMVLVLMVSSASNLLVGCSSSEPEGPVTPYVNKQKPTSSAPRGPEPVLKEEGP